MSFNRGLGLSDPVNPEQTMARAPAAMGVEGMFQQIMGVVQKSAGEIAELRKQCAELRIANSNLERMVKEATMTGYHSGAHTPGFVTPAPGSPKLRAKSPFLSPSAIPSLAVPSTVFTPSPLGDNSLTAYPFQSREIPGFYVVIPAGGAGTRLWPLSREEHPKFLLDVSLCGRSLLQATWDRLLPLTTAARTTVVAGPAHSHAIREQLPDLLPTNLFTEPGPKDSMAAIGLAAAILAQRDPDAIIGSFAADHMIHGDDAFLAAVAEAVEVARENYLVTIGIAPSQPATGFGYVRLGSRLNLSNAPNARLVGSFKEKPDARTAATYLATGQYRWNAGMFVTKATFLMELLKEYKPELHEGLARIASCWDDEFARQTVLSEVWSKLEKIPIDNAVAEPAAAQGRVAVVPATFGWDDVGDFSSLSEMLPAEANQPKVLGDHHLVLTEQVAGGIVVPGSGRLVACLGVDDLVIVDMPDALMVTTRARSQEVKRLVKKCKDQGWKSVL
ncbi:mannose-1-phosphate guanylyltransferase [Pyrrhoderma noxium]|uniref:Mannose-1-phosphate guanylyltransferase n=1 Tax=Pyrrhoderma noxium TaxID=2282107 RepID=A0A286UEZ9_9AGAM|nr:mannose-1-phosphate guanylyltransferase [Pyrrhoderma noxium]